MRKVELLAPAGNYETMVGAFNAGADAVYLGGQGFGARAFADNFTNEEVIKAIQYAHLHGKKIYLTVNTLLKENEIPAFKEFFEPFAMAGLDGAIIQDFGVFRMIREMFPWVELHVSTQMTITGEGGAKHLMELGAKRIVPARELSLSEIENIHNNCKFSNGESVEIEAFIHGAMCYCYSGACLFSSMVGERSGNRGRCAQPCRLPYKSGKRECYPLSLKDMCMVDRIPELIEAGIDSFKIEGRMKKPEYAAGVTSVYRKYIDRYYELAESDSFEKGKIKLDASEADKKILSALYLRSEIGEGYYFRHNSKDMVTIDNPAYNGSDENVLNTIREKYLTGEKKINVNLTGRFFVGEPATITIETDGSISESKISVTKTGDIVQEALKKPMSEDDITKQLSKFGNTWFELKDISLDIDDKGIFAANKSLNELRRNACEALLNAIINNQKANGVCESSEGTLSAGSDENDINSHDNKELMNRQDLTDDTDSDRDIFAVSVMNNAQLTSVFKHASGTDKSLRIYADSRIIEFDSNELKDIPSNVSIYVSLPYIIRNESFFDGHKEIREILNKADDLNLTGVLVRNLEELYVIKESGYKGKVVLDYGLYIWNHEALLLYKELCGDDVLKAFNLPLELSLHEMNEFLDSLYNGSEGECDYSLIPEAGLMVYGRVPMMLTAGCVKNTLEGCSGNRGRLSDYGMTNLVDRTGRTLPVTYDCQHCMNIIWNSVPVSLFKKTKKIRRFSDKYNILYRIDFTTENEKEVSEILNAYNGIFYNHTDKKSSEFDYILSKQDYTTGHFERSAD
ncbi:U32 family peptidase [Butyrivibrio sp. WCE2006]|uniref:U32 family peptidase n=1 Tax=Butyrivibrio sp. WCE2006 TaxID=1410611 RepID=UPI0005D1684F|nr:U32 family peptidase [Butyrivibrio sp. WCE2006]